MRRGDIVTATEAPAPGYIGTAMVIEAIDCPFLRVYILDWERSVTLDMRQTKVVTLSKDMITGALLNTLHKYEKADPEPAKPELPVPAEGCVWWEVIEIDCVLYAAGTDVSGLLFELPSNKRWTGRMLWCTLAQTGWFVREEGEWRVEGRWPDYVEMKIND